MTKNNIQESLLLSAISNSRYHAPQDEGSASSSIALSKTRTVITPMTSLLIHDEHMSLKRVISHAERRERIFRKICWDGLCTASYPDYICEDLARFRIGERSFLTIVDNLRALR